MPSTRTSLVKNPLVSIIDDDLSVREATTSLLESHGYLTAAFASAEEFLGSERLQDTSCLVTDVRMPGVNGIDLQRRLLDAGHRIPTIFMTAYPEEHMRAAALDAGALAFLAKPVSEERLISCLEGALEKGRRQ
jgi:FixJ family two-component response regulator